MIKRCRKWGGLPPLTPDFPHSPPLGSLPRYPYMLQLFLVHSMETSFLPPLLSLGFGNLLFLAVLRSDHPGTGMQNTGLLMWSFGPTRKGALDISNNGNRTTV